MIEPTVLYLILLFRVLVVGGFMLLLPRIVRRGLLFGVYVGEDTGGYAVRELMRSWNRGCLIVMSAALAVGLAIGLAGWPVAGNLTGTAVLLLLALGHYLRTYSKARALAPPDAKRQAVRAAAPLQGDEPRGETLAIVTLGICSLVCLATLTWTIVRYRAMPDEVSAASVLWLPSLDLLLAPFLALLALLTSRAKRSVREGSGGLSAEAQAVFRATVSRLLSVVALLICALLTLLSVQVVRLSLKATDTLGVAFWWLAGLAFLFMLLSQIWILRRYGQGGARMEGSESARPLAGGLADNEHWVWGMFYVDREDPSVMVEKRFGLGYSFNYGNRKAMWIVSTFIALTLSLIALPFIVTAV
jgi:uncharacterized membrane protein